MKTTMLRTAAMVAAVAATLASCSRPPRSAPSESGKTPPVEAVTKRPEIAEADPPAPATPAAEPEFETDLPVDPVEVEEDADGVLPVAESIHLWSEPTPALPDGEVSGLGANEDFGRSIGLGSSGGGMFAGRRGGRRSHRRGKATIGLDDPAPVSEPGFHWTRSEGRACFGVDIDTASHGILASRLRSGALPPIDAIRVEEIINAFDYARPPRRQGQSFGLTVETGPCPWRDGGRLLRVHLRGMEDPAALKRPPAHLIFLVDVSGSMNQTAKLPLVKSALLRLLPHLGDEDRVSLVTYSVAVSVLLEARSVADRETIARAIVGLEAGGGTNGAEGLRRAYEIADRTRVPGTLQRVILATDGDFNVGETERNELVALIRGHAGGRVFLSVLGFGTDNLKDGRLETMADKGDGHYDFVGDSAAADRVLGRQATGLLAMSAKDMKIRVEFNPARVLKWRLVGYENRAVAPQDFRDDGVDGGELGVDRGVTALFEYVPAADPFSPEDNGRYVTPELRPTSVGPERFADELAFLEIRYRLPGSKAVREFEEAIPAEASAEAAASADFRFAAGLAAFAQKLRRSEHAGTITDRELLELLRGAVLDDPDRVELLTLVERWQTLAAHR